MWILNNINEILKYSMTIALGLYFFLKYSKWQAPVFIGGIIFSIYIAAILVTLLSGFVFVIRLFF